MDDDSLLDEHDVEPILVGLFEDFGSDCRLQVGLNRGVADAAVGCVRFVEGYRQRLSGAGGSLADVVCVVCQQVHVRTLDEIRQVRIELRLLGDLGGVGVPVGAEIDGLGLDVRQQGAAVIRGIKDFAGFEALEAAAGGAVGPWAALLFGANRAAGKQSAGKRSEQPCELVEEAFPHEYEEVGLTGRARRAALQHESGDQMGQAIREKISGGWIFGGWNYAYAASFFLGPWFDTSCLSEMTWDHKMAVCVMHFMHGRAYFWRPPSKVWLG